MFKVGLKVMMSRHQHTHPPMFFEAKWIRFRRLCLYRPTVQSQWVGPGDETEAAFKVFSVG